MKLRYDPQVDAAYVTRDKARVAESEQVRPGIVLDLDGRSRVVGIGILNVRRTFPQADAKRLELEWPPPPPSAFIPPASSSFTLHPFEEMSVFGEVRNVNPDTSAAWRRQRRLKSIQVID